MTTANDDFNRANGAVGSNWASDGTADWEIFSNKMRRHSGSDLILWRTQAISTDDFDTSYEIVSDGGNGLFGLYCRSNQGAGPENTSESYGFVISMNGSTGWISSYIDGGESILVNVSNVPSMTNGNTYTMRFTGVSNVMTAYVNGTQVATWTGTEVTSGKYAGVSTNQLDLAIDNFLHGDYAVADSNERSLWLGSRGI